VHRFAAQCEALKGQLENFRLRIRIRCAKFQGKRADDAA